METPSFTPEQIKSLNALKGYYDLMNREYSTGLTWYMKEGYNKSIIFEDKNRKPEEDSFRYQIELDGTIMKMYSII